MRPNIQLKIRKRLRQLRHGDAGRPLERSLQRYERIGLSLEAGLRCIITDSSVGWLTRGDAAQLLALSNAELPRRALLAQFFSLENAEDLWASALTMERFGDPLLASSLIPALRSENPDRRRAAARALGWIPGVRRRAVRALIEALLDVSQPLAVREEAAHVGGRQAIPALIQILRDDVLQDEAPGLRFWAIFALGSIPVNQQFVAGPELVRALESRLTDHAEPPGNWSVAKEALATLGRLDPPGTGYRTLFLDTHRDTHRAVLAQGAHISDSDQRWADAYASAEN